MQSVYLINPERTVPAVSASKLYRPDLRKYKHCLNNSNILRYLRLPPRCRLGIRSCNTLGLGIGLFDLEVGTDSNPERSINTLRYVTSLKSEDLSSFAIKTTLAETDST